MQIKHKFKHVKHDDTNSLKYFCINEELRVFKNYKYINCNYYILPLGNQ